MPRISIYVPETLKARIDSLKDELNLSEIACRAFEIKIGELAEARKERDMSAVIERLRASKLTEEGDHEGLGRRHGREWAERYATYPELKRMSKLDADDWCVGEPLAPLGFGRHLVNHVTGGNDNPVFFWKQFLDPDEEHLQDDEDYLRGFILGAQDVHRDVADRL